ncbi:hypothetical protein LLG95_01165 [bacterium]|nr:hypothetical protein [bacterium]
MGWIFARCLAVFALVLGVANPASAAVASANDGFDPNANGTVHAIAIQSDHKIVIGGEFTKVGGVSFSHVARINIDGSVDAVFSGLGANGNVLAVCLQKDGKILVGGLFTSVCGTGRNRIARIYQNGTLDASFNPGSGANGSVNAIAVQPDGKILIGGNFTAINGSTRQRIARLNADGSLDATFNSSADKTINILAVQASGRILAGGAFTTFNGSPRALITRLESDGALDAGFAPLTTDAGGASVNTIAEQTDGRILIAGTFYSIDGAPRHRIARLHRDGAIDADYNPAGGANSYVNAMAVQPDGQVLIGGSFVDVNGMPSVRIARLNPDGTADATFKSGAGATNIVRCIALQADGKVLIGGDFIGYDGLTRNHIARLNLDGSLDRTYIPGPTTTKSSIVRCIAAQPDGRVLLGGYLGYNDYTTFRYFRRFHADGALDATFNPAVEPRNPTAIAVQPDGRILIAGTYQLGSSNQHDHLDRLNADGSLDATFKSCSMDDLIGHVWAIAIQPDGKIIVAGTFTQFNGLARANIARLYADGSLDWTFYPGYGPKNNSYVYAVALQPDGKIVIGGDFTVYNGTPRNRIARINPDGMLDTTFNPGSGANEPVQSLAIQPDGKIVAAGEFTSFNGVSRLNIARLNANGSLDTAFKFTESTTRDFNLVVLQSDGKVIASGNNTVARLNADGSFDHAYVARPDVNATDGDAGGGLALQPDGRALVGGEGIKTILGQYRDNVARISNPDAAVQQLQVEPSAGTVTWLLGGSFPWPCMALFEESADGRAWNKLGWGAPIDKVGYRLTGLKLPIGKNHYVRATGCFTEGQNISAFQSTARFYERSSLYNAAASWLFYK